MANANTPAAAGNDKKTVNASVVFTRDGNSVPQNFPNMGYATLVSLEASLVAAITRFTAWGSSIVATTVDGAAPQDYQSGGPCDLSVELIADFDGGNFTARFSWAGLSTEAANEMQTILTDAVRESGAVPHP